ncbi:DUF2306 domain-containing protein [Tabrizicola sp.]|uniref:DUF2306 domain-containing protein n=1 Tax=Tabrizicola sp. TaxID=2005166 RepID=UPI003F2A347B
MTLTPLLDAPPIIQLHVAAALLAVLLGPIVLLRRSRDVWHRVLGRVWVLAMALTAVSSFWINETRTIGPFSVIHVLSVLTLLGLWDGVRHARAGRTAAHSSMMRTLYVFGIIVPGLFTLAPDRRMGMVLFPDQGWAGFALVASVIVPVILVVLVRQRRGRRTAP